MKLFVNSTKEKAEWEPNNKLRDLPKKSDNSKQIEFSIGSLKTHQL